MIRDENDGITTQTNTQQAQSAPKMQQQNTQQRAQAPRATDQRFVRTGRTEGGDSRVAEALTLFKELQKEAIATQDLKDDTVILKFDRDVAQVGYSAILIVKKATINGSELVTVRPLLMPNNGIKLPVTRHTVQTGLRTETYEESPSLNKIYSESYWNKIENYVRSQLGLAKARIVPVAAYGIPATFSLKEVQALKVLLIKSVNLCDDILYRASGEEPFTIADLKNSEESVTAKIDDRDLAVYTVLGDPIRSDLVVTLGRSPKSVQDNADFYSENHEINQVSLAIDAEINPAAHVPQQPQGIFGSMNQQPQQYVAPLIGTVTITDVRNASSWSANTPEMYLFALSNAFRVSTASQWTKAYYPRKTNGKDYRDIGATGWLSPLNDYIDTKSANFGDPQFAELVTTMFGRHPAYQHDLDRMGENGAMEGLLIDAGDTDPKNVQRRQLATNLIVKYVNNLLGGSGFEKFFDHTKQAILQVTNAIVTKDKYQDEEGEWRDGRELGLIGMLNATQGNKDEFNTWYNAFLNPAQHPVIRAQQLRNIQRAHLGSTVEHGERIVRCRYNPAFIIALDAALADAGLVVAMDNVNDMTSSSHFNGDNDIANFVVQGNASVISSYIDTQRGSNFGMSNGGVGSAFYTETY